MSLNKPCSCQGSNPTCYKCGGWGFIDNISTGRSKLKTNKVSLLKKKPAIPSAASDRHTSLEAPLQQVNKKESNQKILGDKNTDRKSNVSLPTLLISSKSLISCPVCSHFVLAKNIERHIIKCQAKKLIKCPVCLVKVCNNRLERHAKQVHANIDQKIFTSEIQKNDIEFIICKYCSNFFPKSSISKHIESYHLGKYKAQTKAKGQLDKYSNCVNSLEKPIDATRNYYAAYRERGQFGSHPSHDDYGDESDAL